MIQYLLRDAGYSLVEFTKHIHLKMLQYLIEQPQAYSVKRGAPWHAQL
jgi:hypothetical protein